MGSDVSSCASGMEVDAPCWEGRASGKGSPALARLFYPRPNEVAITGRTGNHLCRLLSCGVQARNKARMPRERVEWTGRCFFDGGPSDRYRTKNKRPTWRRVRLQNGELVEVCMACANRHRRNGRFEPKGFSKPSGPRLIEKARVLLDAGLGKRAMRRALCLSYKHSKWVILQIKLQDAKRAGKAS